MTERQKQKEDARRAREEVRAKLEQDRREREDEQRASTLAVKFILAFSICFNNLRSKFTPKEAGSF